MSTAATNETDRVLRHPLDPLSPEEIEQAAEILRTARQLPDTFRFVYITLQEPQKAEIWAYRNGDAIDRHAFVVLSARGKRKKIYEAVVSLGTSAVLSWREIPGVQGPLMRDELAGMTPIIKGDPRWQAALRARGVEDFDRAKFDPWPVGYGGPQDSPDLGRFLNALTWVTSGEEGDNAYARPVEGVIVRLDLDRMEVVDVEDHGVVPLPRHTANYTADAIRSPNNFPSFADGPRSDLRPVEITQPEGTSFEIVGNEVRWQNWRMRIGFTPREGLVLHTVGYVDQGRIRPILHRGSLSEMVVPYGDPRPTHNRKDVFDMGEAGIGLSANSLMLGCDCLGEIYYFDAWVNDIDGNARHIENAVCLHEEDAGILWKHTNSRAGTVEVRRSRRLVVSMFATVGNYDYGFYWYFYQDGTIEYEVKLTGVISNGALPMGEQPEHGTLVAPGVYGPNHQHIFCVRLDMTVDGMENTVEECDSVSYPIGPRNPHGNAWEVRQETITRESEGRRLANTNTARFWRIENEGRRNAVGDPVAYRLEPGPSTPPFHQPETSGLQRAGFSTGNLWVTAYEPRELFAAGDYPNQHPGGAGLPEFVSADRPLERADVVLWHTFVAHHVVRSEDWPVMPVATTGFHLKPSGFFDGNPSLNVPESHHHNHEDPSGYGNHSQVSETTQQGDAR